MAHQTSLFKTRYIQQNLFNLRNLQYITLLPVIAVNNDELLEVGPFQKDAKTVIIQVLSVLVIGLLG